MCCFIIAAWSHSVMMSFLVFPDSPDCVSGRLCFVFYSSLKNLKEVYICPVQGQTGPVRGQVGRNANAPLFLVRVADLTFLQHVMVPEIQSTGVCHHQTYNRLQKPVFKDIPYGDEAFYVIRSFLFLLKYSF